MMTGMSAERLSPSARVQGHLCRHVDVGCGRSVIMQVVRDPDNPDDAPVQPHRPRAAVIRNPSQFGSHALFDHVVGAGQIVAWDVRAGC